MSTESRLARLGLLHLEDKPDELQRELQKIVDAGTEREQGNEVERKDRRRAYLAANPNAPRFASDKDL